MPYDERIDQYNWYLIFGIQFIGYFIAHALIRRLVPEPGPKEDFIKRKKMRDYHTYYFQYTSMIHALMAIIFGKTLIS